MKLQLSHLLQPLKVCDSSGNLFPFPMSDPPEPKEGESQGVNLLIHVVFVASIVDNWAFAKEKKNPRGAMIQSRIVWITSSGK